MIRDPTSFDVKADIQFGEGYPVLVNEGKCAELVAEVGRQILGPEKVKTHYPPSMGGEDFAFYAQRVPAAMFRLGLQPVGSFDFPGLHNPRFNFNDDAIPAGIQMFCGIAHQFLTTRSATGPASVATATPGPRAATGNASEPNTPIVRSAAPTRLPRRPKE